VGFSGAAMPGPLLAVTINHSLRRGFWAGPLIVLGHAILELGIVALLALGLNELMQGTLVKAVIGLVGGAILVWMGISTLVSVYKKIKLPTPSESTGTGSTRSIVISGIVISLSNPYWYIWWVTLGTVYLLWSLELGFLGVMTFFTGHILADLTWYSIIALLFATGRRFLNDTHYRIILGVCGVALAGLGVYFVISGANFLAG